MTQILEQLNPRDLHELASKLSPLQRAEMGIREASRTPVARLVEAVDWLASRRILRSMFNLDQKWSLVEPYAVPDAGAGRNLTWYQAQLAFEATREAIYRLVEEMDAFGLVSSAVDCYAEDATQTDAATGRAVWIEARSAKVRRELMELLDRLAIEDRIFGIARCLAKYGDDFEQNLWDPDKGLMAQQYIQPWGLTRVEDRFGRLVGFVPGIVPQDRLQEIASDPDKVKELGASAPWAFTHFRLYSARRFGTHGEPLILNARRSWRQCVARGTLVWTDCGPREIQNVKPGATVYTHDHETGETRGVEVRAAVCNGRRPVVEIQTRHRAIRVTPDHPVLVCQSDGTFVYKEAATLAASAGVGGAAYHRADALVLPAVAAGAATHVLKLNPDRYCVRLREPVGTPPGIMETLRGLGLETAVKNAHGFLRAQQSIRYADYARLRTVIDLPEQADIYFKGSGRPAPIGADLEYACGEEFCYLLGFLLGDGWMTPNVVGVALGVDEAMNGRVRDLFVRLFGLENPTATDPEPGVSGGKLQYTSSAAADIFRVAGFRTGFARKRVPSWVFRMNAACRMAVVRGLLDADGGRGDGGWRITLANRGLMRDLLTLAQGLGLRVSRELVRVDRENRCPAWRAWIGDALGPCPTRYEPVIRVTPAGEEEVYDLQVDDPLANFVAGGVVVHNCKILQDSLVIYRLNRAPERLVFYVDTTGMGPDDKLRTIEQWRRQYRKRIYLDPTLGLLRQEYNPLGVDEDIFWAKDREGTSTVEKLPGSANPGDIYDVEHFVNMLFGDLRLPKSYFGFEGDIQAKSTLSQQDIRAARTIRRLQRALIYGLTQTCRIHLAMRGADPREAENEFWVRMSPLSYLDELQRSELTQLRVELVNNLLRLGTDVARIDSDAWVEYVLRDYLKLTDEQIERFLRPPGQNGELSPDLRAKVDQAMAQVPPEKTDLLKQAAATSARQDVAVSPNEDAARRLVEARAAKADLRIYDPFQERSALCQQLIAEDRKQRFERLTSACPRCGSQRVQTVASRGQSLLCCLEAGCDLVAEVALN